MINPSTALLSILVSFSTSSLGANHWETISSVGKPTARHEAALTGFGGKLYLIGGRRINPVDVFDPASNRWTAKSPTPLELHHFQAVVLGDRIYLMGAMTGPYPREKPLERVVAYRPQTDKFEMLHAIPADRRRGGAGAVIYNDKIYLVGGITNGHIDGSRPWIDEYDPRTGAWKILPDAPHARDHFQAVVIGDRLYAAAGRTTSQATNQVFDLTVEAIDIFDFKTGNWLPTEECPELPTPRAGNMAIAVDGKLVLGGGESILQRAAHDEIEVYDPVTQAWTKWPALNRGRHGTGFVQIGNHIYTASGCGNRGGSPELDSIERLAISASTAPIVDKDLVFAEKDGLVAVEAEHFVAQTRDGVRAWHLTHAEARPAVQPDGDPSHVDGASGGAYLEILPDTRRTHGDKLIRGRNFSPQAGKMAVLDYKVNIRTPGRYYVWVRAYSTGTEDNGLHVGLDGEWPESGQRLQWCEGKMSWRWESKQRTEAQHCGEPHKIFLDIEKPGEHTIHFSMREDGFEFDKWLMTTNRDFARPVGVGPQSKSRKGMLPATFAMAKLQSESAETTTEGISRADSPTKPVSDAALIEPRKPHGDGRVQVSGELKQWHNVTLTLDGPYAHEQDNLPNPFTDYRMSVTFTHESGKKYDVPGYFAADGDAKNSSAESGTKWRAHFAPDATGAWKYQITFHQGKHAAVDSDSAARALPPFDGKTGSINIAKSDKTGRDLRAHGRLQYVGQRYLRFAGSGQYFLKAGADAPETLLAYADFDNTVAGNPRKAPLKTWAPHLHDWKEDDPTWKSGKGKGLIGAINYLSGKGCNAFSFLTYNAGGDGDNVWPFIQREDKLHYDCSKLDQWATIFEHGTQKGMYLHFKMQETENDDHNKGKNVAAFVPECLDGGNLGVQRKLYCRELIARFGHNLALNWNLGEENTQTTAQQKAMIDYIAELDPYDHNIVVHTFPDQQDKVYRPLLGSKSKLTGASLQNSSLKTTHAQTVKWVEASTSAGKPWVVAFDESGSAAHAQCPDLGYRGFDGHDRQGKMVYTQHEVRKQTLWGHLMGGGAGCEYYFGYQFAENDIVCEDWRSRDQSWDYCRIAIQFFHQNKIPFWEMHCRDELVGNPDHGISKFCLAEQNDTYLVYLPNGGETKLDLSEAKGEFSVHWFNPREGGELTRGDVTKVTGGNEVSLGTPPVDPHEDWLAVVRSL